MQKRQFTIYGRVQGVAFRFYTRQQALKIGVKGYVKNLQEGSVLTVIEGTEQQISEMREWLKVGSPASKVTNIIEQIYEGEREFDGFDVEH